MRHEAPVHFLNLPKDAEMISTMADKAYDINNNTIHEMVERAVRENWSAAQCIGMLTQDSASISSGVNRNYVYQHIVGGNESHHIGGPTLFF